jgi:hypothetical protein
VRIPDKRGGNSEIDTAIGEMTLGVGAGALAALPSRRRAAVRREGEWSRPGEKTHGVCSGGARWRGAPPAERNTSPTLSPSSPLLVLRANVER